jgi:uncharacterized protein (DUF1501 family)
MQRRKFLKNIGAGVALPTVLNGFGVAAFAGSPVQSFINAPTTDTDHVLVIIQMAGGNDGLNTVVPLDQYDQLMTSRQEVVLPENGVLKITDKVGLHPAMNGMRDLYDSGRLQVVQNVGYPNFNYSHFRATDIWMSGADANEYLPSGWAGRYLNYEYPNYPNDYPNPEMPHPLAVEIGYSLSLSLMGPQTSMGYVIPNADSFYNLVAGVQDPAPNTPAGEQLAYVRAIAKQSRAYNQSVIDAYNAVSQQIAYPDTELATKLKIISRLIAGGLKTRLYIVTIDGFDTHAEQVDANDHTTGAHADLLGQVSNAVKAFSDDLDYQGTSGRVTGITTSEFGRRIVSNSSGGTDHGAAAPMFVFGKYVKGGILGDNPVIPNNPTDEDNVPMQFDFRSVYSTVLRDWFCVPDADVQGIVLHNLPYLNLFDSSTPCVSTATHEANQQAGRSYLRFAPNPFTVATTIEYESLGGPTQIRIADTAGKTVEMLVNAWQSAGTHQVLWAPDNLPAGTYFCHLRTGSMQQAKMVVKM